MAVGRPPYPGQLAVNGHMQAGTAARIASMVDREHTPSTADREHTTNEILYSAVDHEYTTNGILHSTVDREHTPSTADREHTTNEISILATSTNDMLPAAIDAATCRWTLTSYYTSGLHASLILSCRDSMVQLSC